MFYGWNRRNSIRDCSDLDPLALCARVGVCMSEWHKAASFLCMFTAVTIKSICKWYFNNVFVHACLFFSSFLSFHLAWSTLLCLLLPVTSRRVPHVSSSVNDTKQLSTSAGPNLSSHLSALVSFCRSGCSRTARTGPLLHRFCCSSLQNPNGIN